MDEFEVQDAYKTAIAFLLAGAMPVIVDAEDGLHVLSCIPTDRESLAAMINPDVRARMQFLVNTTVMLKNRVEEAAAQ